MTSMASAKLARRLMKTGREERGSMLVEFAVVICVMLALIFGIMYFCMAVYTDVFVGYAAAEGARYAMVRGSSWNNAVCSTVTAPSCTATSANVTSFVNSLATPGINSGSSLTVVTTWTGKTAKGASCSTTSTYNSPGCIVEVQVSYSFNFIAPFVPASTMLLSSTAEVTIAY